MIIYCENMLAMLRVVLRHFFTWFSTKVGPGCASDFFDFFFQRFLVT